MVKQSLGFNKKRKSTRFLRLFIGIVVVAVVVFVISWFVRLPIFVINSIQINGADSDIAPLLQTAADKTLEGNYMGIFSRRSIITYPRSGLAKNLKDISPRIDSVIVHADGLHQILIAVIEKTPSVIACPELPDFDNHSLTGCYLVDKNGFAFQNVPDSYPQTYARFYAPDATLGSFVASSSRFSQLQNAYDTVSQKGINVQGILIKPGYEYEMYVKGKSDMTVIYFNEAQPIMKEISNLITFWSNGVVASSSSSSSPSSLEYIDVRYGSNIFYR